MDFAINIIASTKVNYILDAIACALEVTDYHERTDLPIILKAILICNISRWKMVSDVYKWVFEQENKYWNTFL